jgi:hypothetical protein
MIFCKDRSIFCFAKDDKKEEREQRRKRRRLAVVEMGVLPFPFFLLP